MIAMARLKILSPAAHALLVIGAISSLRDATVATASSGHAVLSNMEQAAAKFRQLGGTGSRPPHANVPLRHEDDIMSTPIGAYNRVVEEHEEGGDRRNLQGSFESEVCDSWITIVDDAKSCTCDESSYTVGCEIKNTLCVPESACMGGQVCFKLSMASTFSLTPPPSNSFTRQYSTNGFTITSGSGFDGYRQVNLYDDFGFDERCELYFSIDGVEFRCNSCDINFNNEDCTNVHPSFVAGYRGTEEELGKFLCPPGGVGTPTGGRVDTSSAVATRRPLFAASWTAAGFFFLLSDIALAPFMI